MKLLITRWPSTAKIWNKVIPILRCTTILLMASCLHISAKSFSQKINLSEKGISLPKLFAKIYRQSGTQFFYRDKVLDKAGKVSVKVSDATLEQALDISLKGTLLTYEIVNNTVVIKEKELVSPKTLEIIPQTAILKQVSGKVKDKDGNGIPGVNILEVGTNNGTTSNSDGTFALSLLSDKSQVAFSFIGYVTQTIEVGNSNNLEVILLEDQMLLKETVVVGYVTQTKSSLTGSVATVDKKVIEARPLTNLAIGLQGAAPGLQITRSSGQPGNEKIDFSIRGATSANGNIQPLLIVDGVFAETSTLNNLNPNDVETFTILKDASAAAIYGARAAGGVIIVKTKTGASGTVKFDLSVMQSYSKVLNPPRRASLEDIFTFKNAASVNEFGDADGSRAKALARDLDYIRRGENYYVNPDDPSRYLLYNTVRPESYALLDKSPQQNYNLSASGGTEKLNFYASGGFMHRQGMLTHDRDEFTRGNLRLNVNGQLTKIFSFESRLSYTNELTKDPNAGEIGNNNYGLLYQLYQDNYWNYPSFDAQGNYAGGASSTIFGESYYNKRNNNFDGIGSLTAANFIKGLTLKVVLSKQHRTSRYDYYSKPLQTYNASYVASTPNTLGPPNYSVGIDLFKYTDAQLLATYNRTFSDKHTISLLGGYNYTNYDKQYVSLSANQLTTNNLINLNYADAINKSLGQDFDQNAFSSFFGKAGYNFADRYYVDFTLRRDESSKLAPGKRIQTFPSIGVAWSLNSEPWFENLTTAFSALKVRASWGRLGGSSGIGSYEWANRISRNGSSVMIGNQYAVTYAQNSIPSSSLTWENIETTNFGLDVGVLRNKLNVTFDYYFKNNNTMFVNQVLPAILGVTPPRVNEGILKTHGWELALNYKGKSGKDFNYNVGFNIWDSQNKLIKFNKNLVINPGVINQLEGYPLSTVWGYQTDGYYSSKDDVANSAKIDNPKIGPGDVKYVDQNGDGKINSGGNIIDNPGDLKYFGTTAPRFQFGLNLFASYKGFDLTLFLQGVAKRNYIPNQEIYAALSSTWRNPQQIHMDAWTPENTDAMFPRPFNQASWNWVQSDKWILNGAYMRMKNVQLGYSLNENWVKKAKITRARIYVSAQDVLTISRLGKFKQLFDPEYVNGTSFQYPLFGTVAVGLNLTF